MELECLEICGFHHFRDPARLDLRNLRPGLVAIVGQNGEGKSRLLDGGLASVYGPGINGAFPSREGILAEYATSRHAYIDAIWWLAPFHYHVRLSVDGVQRATQAVIERINDIGEIDILNDGKVSTYREVIAQIFPTRQQILASAYAAQGRQGSFADLGQAKRLELFSEMLGLDRYGAMSLTAKECAALADKMIFQLDAELAALGRITTPEMGDHFAQLVWQYDAEAGEADHDLQENQRAIAHLEKTGQALMKRVDAFAKVNERILALMPQKERIANGLAAIEQEKADVRTRYQRGLANRTVAFKQAIRDLEDRQQAHRNEYDVQHRINEGEIQSRQQLADNADVLRQQGERREILTQRMAELRQELVTATEAKAAEDANLRDADQRLSRRQLHEQEAATAKRQAEIVHDVPCKGEGIYQSCQFLADAVNSRPRLIELRKLLRDTVDAEAVIAKAEAQSQIHGATMLRLHAQLAEMEQQQKMLPAADVLVRLEQVSSEIALWRHRDMSAASMRDRHIADLDLSIKSLEHEQLRAQTGADAEEQAAYDTLRVRREALELDAATVNQQILDLTADLPDDPTESLRENVQAIETALAHKRLIEHNLIRLEMAIAENQRQQQAYEARVAEMADITARRNVLQDEFLAWRLLTQALGRDGLPKLEIDAAGPTVSDLTNTLLEVGYGTRFSVDLTTQVARADGKGLKEEFALRVFDNEHGGEPRDISDLSGGERVVVEEALRAGILLFNNSRQQIPIRTCWRDETTGALFPSNIPKYVAMLRRMHELGGFRHTLFVTHSEAAADLADVVIRVADGIPSVERAA